MGKRSRTQQLSDGILGQHLGLSVAAHLARTQLVADPLRVYDSQHLSEMLDLVANALVRVAPLYVHDMTLGAPRQLTEAEREGASVRRGATILVLRDARVLSALSMKRTDLRQAIAILKAVGIPEFGRPAQPTAQAEPPHDRLAELSGQIDELDRALQAPLLPQQLGATNRLLVAIARNSPRGEIANLAMQLMSAVQHARTNADAPDARTELLLAQLRAAVGAAKRERLDGRP